MARQAGDLPPWAGGGGRGYRRESFLVSGGAPTSAALAHPGARLLTTCSSGWRMAPCGLAQLSMQLSTTCGSHLWVVGKFPNFVLI